MSTTSTFSNSDDGMSIQYGTEFKLNVNMEEIDGYSMGDVDFVCYFYTSSSTVVEIEKADMIEVDEDNYVAVLSSEDIGYGFITIKYEADIPDADFDDGLRHEVVIIKTPLRIV